MTRARRAAALAVAGGVVGAGIAAGVSWAIPRDRPPAVRAVAAPRVRNVDHDARLRASGLRFVPAYGDARAALDFDVRNEGTAPATGIGYVLQDGTIAVAYQETSVLGPGEGEHQRLSWASAGAGPRHLTLTIGDGNVKWAVHEFDVAATLAPGRARAPAPAGVAVGGGAGAALGGLTTIAARRRRALSALHVAQRQ